MGDGWWFGMLKEKVGMFFTRRSDFTEFIMNIPKGVMIFTLSMVVILVVLGVIARYFLHISIPGLEELSLTAAVWAYFLGAAWATVEGTQIKAELITLIKREKVIKVLRLLAMVLSICICVVFAYFAFSYCHWILVAHVASPTLRYPILIDTLSILVGFVLICTSLVIQVIKSMQTAKDGSSADV